MMREFDLNLLVIKVKKFFSNILIFETKNIILEPACDLNFANYKFKNTKFLNLKEKLTKFMTPIEINEDFYNQKYINLENYFISALVKKKFTINKLL